MLEPMAASTPKKDRVSCLDLYDSDSSFSSDFATPAKKRPRNASSRRENCIDLNDTYTSEHMDATPIKVNSESPVCIDIVDTDDEEQCIKGKLRYGVVSFIGR